ncbi:MAG: hypothetical protein AAF402_02085 [Pseudomonadota bacterium]
MSKSDKNHHSSASRKRRKLLLGLSGVAGASQLDNQWTKPIVEHISLPAHATTTNDGGAGSDGTDGSFNYSGAPPRVSVSRFSDDETMIVSLTGLLLSDVHAGNPPSTTTVGPEPTPMPEPTAPPRPEATWNVAVTGSEAVVTRLSRRRSKLRTARVTIGGPSVPFPVVDECGNDINPVVSVSAVAHTPGTSIVMRVDDAQNGSSVATVPLGPVLVLTIDCAGF